MHYSKFPGVKLAELEQEGRLSSNYDGRYCCSVNTIIEPSRKPIGTPGLDLRVHTEAVEATRDAPTTTGISESVGMG